MDLFRLTRTLIIGGNKYGLSLLMITLYM